MKIIIVDEADKEIDLKERDSVGSSDIYRVSALWLTNTNGEILLSQRKLTKKRDPGKWGPAAAGTVEEGETYESNIYKEAKEEIGLEGGIFQLGPKIFRNSENKYFVQWFIGVTNMGLSDFKIQEEEVEGLKYVTKEFLARDIRSQPEKYVVSAHTWATLLNL